MRRMHGRRVRPAAESLEGRQMMDVGLGATPSEPIPIPIPVSDVSATTGLPDGPTATPEALAFASSEVSVTSGSTATPVDEAAIAATSAPPPRVSVAQDVPKPLKRFAYITNDRTRVVVNLTGIGTLRGTQFDRSTNSLRLIYDDTNDASQIIAHVRGGNGRANLSLLTDADVPPNSQSGIGGNQVGLVAMKAFRLVEGGRINLNGGVRKLKLNEVGPNTQVLLRSLPNETPESGQTTQFSNSPLIGNELQLTDGTVIPVIFDTSEEPSDEPPPGIRVQIDRISGTFVPTNTERGDLATLGNPQLFGYDAGAGQLLRFDAVTGQVTGRRTVPSLDSSSAGVSLGRNAGNLVVVVAQASTVRVFDALTLDPVGQFTTANIGFDSIDGLAKTDTQLAVVQGVNPSDPASGPGKSRLIELTLSLARGEAVPLDQSSFQLQPGVFMTSGATGVAGYEAFAATAAATFDQFQPLSLFPGIAELRTTNRQIVQQQLTRSNAVPASVPVESLAMGSVDQFVAVGQGVSVVEGRTVNRVTLIDPEALTTVRTISLDYPAPLVGLSESYRPSLEGAALFDVQGDIQAFLVNQANGLVLNDSGVLNLLAVRRMSDSVVIGLPVVHVDVIARNNVGIFSTERPVGSRGGVTVVKNLPPPGPLTLP